MQFLRALPKFKPTWRLPTGGARRFPSAATQAVAPPWPRRLINPSLSVADITYTQVTDETLNLSWSDGLHSSFHHIWLRDNCHCPACRHPVAEERMHDTLAIPMNISPTTVEAVPATSTTEAAIRIAWDDGHISRFPVAFLLENCYERQTAEAKAPSQQVLWTAADIAPSLPRLAYDHVRTDAGLRDWLETLDAYGFTLIEGVPDGDDAVCSMAERIGFVRNTFWGPTWSVKSEPMPMNLSMTSEALHPHTDFGWSEAPPGLQFLHCVAFSSTDTVGGESTLADGFAIAAQLRVEHPDAYHLLTTTDVDHCFSSDSQWFEHRGPILREDPRTHEVTDVRFNQANRSPLRLPPALVRPYYDAMRQWTAATRDPANLLRFRLREGDLLVFNNRRLLHGRTGYDAQATWRHLKGCYLDAEDYRSKLAMMRRGLGRRHMSTERYVRPAASDSPQLDPGFDAFTPAFVAAALSGVEDVIASGATYDDGSRLCDVAAAGAAKFRNLNEGTKADYVYQCSLYDHDIKTNLVPRLLGMLHKLEGDHIRLGTGTQVDLLEHSLQCATLAHADGADDELVVCALLHDVGELLSPCNHGEIAGAILRPYISPERYWILAHHEIFQGYYYFHHVGGDRDTRAQFVDHPQYEATVDFCHKYDQAAFDPQFESLPVAFFEPLLRRVLARKAYWFAPGHPKLGCVTGASLT
ncbi:gamma-butyrobetaine dioxygenase [Achlya hypogyna]|uniref:Gamma-butyrobetaine dioxygenase n=1 Tax=Achlya hypogyna TaxID=1202772 RepID=A0A1V9Z6V1_ACHHY|nr:gamma-butyrobetaine dioxygenase [Achlya hypogyna]